MLVCFYELDSELYASLCRKTLSTEVGQSVGETGALQLLFDVRFLRDVFVGSLPSPRSSANQTSPEGQQELVKIASEFESVEELLQVCVQ